MLKLQFHTPQKSTKIFGKIHHLLIFHASNSISIRFTYLDSKLNGGRKVIVLNAKNVVEEHEDQIVVSYKFEQKLMLIEPLMIVAAYLFLFIVCIVIARTTSIARSNDSSNKPSVPSNQAN